MPSPFYGRSTYARDRGDLPELPLINMFAEMSPVEEDQIILQSRPGIEQFATAGSGPIHGLFQRDGALSGTRFAISGGSLYASTTLVGAVDGSGPVSWAASSTQLVFTRGESLTLTNGITVTQPVFPDDANVIAVADLAGYFIAVRANSQVFYWSEVLDGSSWDALDFASAESEPDRLLQVIALDDYLVLLGSETTEFWSKTGNAETPFVPVQGRVYEKGLLKTGCASTFDNGFAWIGNEGGLVYRSGNVPERISDNGIEERINKSASHFVYSFFFEGHEFLAIRLDQGTWLYDASTRTWSEFASYGRGNWRCQHAIAGPFFGDDQTGAIWRFGAGHQDNGGVLERRFRGGLPIKGGTLTVDNIRFDVNAGKTPDLTGFYADPIMEVRFSRDHGQTFAAWKSMSLGRQGKYRTRAERRACGMFDSPSMIFEARCTDPVPFRVSGVTVNEPSGGRSR